MRFRFTGCLVILGLVLNGAPAWGQEKEKAPTQPAEAAQKPVTPVAPATAEKPDPKEVLRRMCDYLKGLKEFSYKGEVTDDHTYSAGNKLQFAFGLEGYVKRPDKVRLIAKGDLQNKEFFYDGKAITIYDTVKKVYGTTAMPPTIDEALDKASSDYGIRLIMAQLAKTNLFEEVTQGIEDSVYVGQGTVFGVIVPSRGFRQGEDRGAGLRGGLGQAGAPQGGATPGPA